MFCHFVIKIMKRPLAGKCSQEIWFGTIISSILCFILLRFDYSTTFPDDNNAVKRPPTQSCCGGYMYIHDDLPAKFSKNLLSNCKSLTRSDKPNMCPYLENFGFGPEINNSDGVLVEQSWYSTNQFSLDVIFHNKMKQYGCLTSNSILASAIYIPIYAGLEDSLHLWDSNLTVRDSFGLNFVNWVSRRYEWKKMWGRDHFFVVGRISWDFRRKTDNNTGWGSKFRFLPESKNMTVLSNEGSSWTNDIAIRYPKGFHPVKDREVFQWQTKMRKQERPYLFAFVGAPRPKLESSNRGKLIEQCQATSSCKLLDCNENNCEHPIPIMRAFQNSLYCLQPTGDSYTSKSTH